MDVLFAQPQTILHRFEVSHLNRRILQRKYPVQVTIDRENFDAESFLMQKHKPPMLIEFQTGKEFER